MVPMILHFSVFVRHQKVQTANLTCALGMFLKYLTVQDSTFFVSETVICDITVYTSTARRYIRSFEIKGELYHNDIYNIALSPNIKGVN